MHSTSVLRSGEKESVYWLTSTALAQAGFCLTLNLSERPRMENPSRLSEILDERPDARYTLSARACQGIMNRAARRGKELPEVLRTALEKQASSEAEDDGSDLEN